MQYFSSAASDRICLRTSGATSCWLFRARLTVDLDTPAWRASSRIVIFFIRSESVRPKPDPCRRSFVPDDSFCSFFCFQSVRVTFSSRLPRKVEQTGRKTDAVFSKNHELPSNINLDCGISSFVPECPGGMRLQTIVIFLSSLILTNDEALSAE